jgi:hypothetical protein
MKTRPEEKIEDAQQKPDPAPVPDGQERLATQPERDDVNGRIDRSN